jgi:hypothetical protein
MSHSQLKNDPATLNVGVFSTDFAAALDWILVNLKKFKTNLSIKLTSNKGVG